MINFQVPQVKKKQVKNAPPTVVNNRSLSLHVIFKIMRSLNFKEMY